MCSFFQSPAYEQADGLVISGECRLEKYTKRCLRCLDHHKIAHNLRSCLPITHRNRQTAIHPYTSRWLSRLLTNMLMVWSSAVNVDFKKGTSSFFRYLETALSLTPCYEQADKHRNHPPPVVGTWLRRLRTNRLMVWLSAVNADLVRLKSSWADSVPTGSRTRILEYADIVEKTVRGAHWSALCS